MNITDESPFPLPQFEDRLWSELEQRHREPSEGLLSGRGLSPSGPRRRGRYLAAVGGLAAAASLAVGFVVTRGGDEADPTGTASPTETTAPTPTTATTAAPTPAGPNEDAIAVTEIRDPAGQLLFRRWTDEATGNYRLVRYGADEQPGWEDNGVRQRFFMPGGGPNGVSQVTLGGAEVSVSHAERTFARLPAFTPPPGNGFQPTPPQAQTMVAKAIEVGALVADGTEVVDGVTLNRYKNVEAIDAVPTIVSVDPATGRPVKILTYDGTERAAVATVTYLARTAATIALADLVVPSDYTESENSVPENTGSDLTATTGTVPSNITDEVRSERAAANEEAAKRAALYWG